MDLISVFAYSFLVLLILGSVIVVGIYTLQSKSLEWSSDLLYLRDSGLISDIDLEREVMNPPWYVSLSNNIFYIQLKLGNKDG